MLFRRIILSALLIGLASGLVMTLVMQFGVSPIIYAAEAFETADEAQGNAPVAAHHSHGHDHGSPATHEGASHHGAPSATTAAQGHQHSADAWAPEDGAERVLFTLVSNVFAGIGFAAMLLAVMSQLQLQGVTSASLSKGLIWGAAGFIVFFAAPGVGLPPEIPGVEAAAIEHRQWWWLLCVVAAAAALALFAFLPGPGKWLGTPLLGLPFVVGAPHPEGPLFAAADQQATIALTALHQQFVIASALTNLVFWMVLGLLCAWMIKRFVLVGYQAHA